MWIEKHGPSWRIRDDVGGRKATVKSGIPTKTAAKALMTQLKADKLRGDALVHRGGEVTLGDWIDYFWPSYEVALKASTKVSARGLVHRYIRPMLGGIELADIGPLVVQRWVADLLAGRTKAKKPKPLSRKTVGNAHGLLHRIMGEAVGARMIRSNPCERTRLPEKTHHEMLFLTEPQAQRLIAATPEHWRALVLLLLGTGLRWGEAVGLRVKDVDVLAGRLDVRRNLQELADTAQMVEEAPKTAASRRSVTFTKDVAAALIPLVVDKDAEARVFLAPKGGLVRYRVFWPVWNRVRVEAGLPRLRIHDLRHTHASWLIAAGIPLTAIQRRLGHSSIRVTSDIYGHILPEIDDKIVTALDSRLPRLDGGPVGESVYHEIPQETTRRDAMPRPTGV